MINSTNNKKFYFKTSAIYEIVVEGILDNSLSDKLGGMQIIVGNKNDINPTSLLVGRILDQSALSGILNTLYEHRIAIISVKMQKDYTKE